MNDSAEFRDDMTKNGETTETADTSDKKDESAMPPEQPDKENSPSLLRDAIEIVESTLITVFAIVMIFTYLLHPVNIVGHSMVPTLNKHYDETKQTDKIFMTTVYLGINYGDIIVIDEDKNYLLNENGEAYVPDQSTAQSLSECIIKRVIATGGQSVDIHDNQVIVDGIVLDEPYIASGSTTVDLGAFTGQYPITVPEGYLFVMGDNRNQSSDSRDRHVGLVSEDQVYGKAIVKYSPLSEFRILINSWKRSENE